MPCFAFNSAEEGVLIFEWDTIARAYPGWGLSDIKDMTPRERKNWLEVIRVREGRSRRG